MKERQKKARLRHITYNDQDVEVINFIKNKGVRVKDVLEKEWGYDGWIMKVDFPLDTKKVLTAIKLS